MHFPPSSPLFVTFSLSILLTMTHACMHYTASLPFSPTLPFAASILDNSVTVCWISTTYAEHKGLEMAVLQQKKNDLRSVGDEKKKNFVSLTGKQGLRVGEKVGGEGGAGKGREVGWDIKGFAMLDEEELRSRRRICGQKKLMDVPKDDKDAGSLPWEFECLEGYKARAHVGARTVTYIAHGQEFYFIPTEKEDFEREKWVYDLKLWCGKPGENGVIAP